MGLGYTKGIHQTVNVPTRTSSRVVSIGIKRKSRKQWRQLTVLFISVLIDQWRSGMNPKDAKEKFKAVERDISPTWKKWSYLHFHIYIGGEKKRDYRLVWHLHILQYSPFLRPSSASCSAFLQTKPICAEIILSILVSHEASAYVQNQYVVTLSRDHRKDNKWASSQGLDASLILSFVFSHNHHIDLKRAPVELNNTFNTNTIKCQSYTSNVWHGNSRSSKIIFPCCFWSLY